MKHLAIALTLILAAAPARGEEPLPTDYTSTLGVAMEINRLAALLGDVGLRELVCRLSSERYTFGSLSSTLGMPEGQVMRRINTLRGWGLVRTVRQGSARTIVEPMPGDGTRTLRRWAERYCPTGDSCQRPVVNSGAQEERRGRTTSGLGGIASLGESEAGLRDKLVTVFGGAGFLGRDLVRHLLESGARVRIASRKPASAVFPKSLIGDNRLSTMVVDASRGRGVAAAVAGASMVVNLVGIQSETDDLKFSDINEIASSRIAEAAAEASVERLVHVSTISAALESRSIFARTKMAGESAAREQFPKVTFVRPSLVLGDDGGFLKRVVEVSRHTPVQPLVRAGKPLFQPVYVGDVSEAIVRILKVPETKGRTFELGGPRTMTLREIVDMATREDGQDRPASTLPAWVEEARAALVGSLPRSLRQQESFPGRDFVVRSNALGLADLGITPTSIEDVVAAFRARY